MDFMTSIKTCLGKYADFNGRARRSEFWWWILATEVVNILLRVLGVPLLATLVALAVFVPTLAVGSRRLHDTGRSGWWQLIALTVIGIILLIVWWAEDSKPGDNPHGPNPKGVGAAGGGAWGTPPPPPGDPFAKQ